MHFHKAKDFMAALHLTCIHTLWQYCKTHYQRYVYCKLTHVNKIIFIGLFGICVCMCVSRQMLYVIAVLSCPVLGVWSDFKWCLSLNFYHIVSIIIYTHDSLTFYGTSSTPLSLLWNKCWNTLFWLKWKTMISFPLSPECLAPTRFWQQNHIPECEITALSSCLISLAP